MTLRQTNVYDIHMWKPRLLLNIQLIYDRFRYNKTWSSKDVPDILSKSVRIPIWDKLTQFWDKEVSEYLLQWATIFMDAF